MAHQPGNPFPINGTGASRRNMIDCSGNRREVSTEHTKIFVGGLAWETTRESLKRHFDQFGEIWEAVVIGDKYSGRSKGYGFVTFTDPDAAYRACAHTEPIIDGRRTNCNMAFIGAKGGGSAHHGAAGDNQQQQQQQQQQAIRVKPQPPVITPNACVYNYMPPQPSHYNQFPYYGYYGPYGPYGPDYSMQGYYSLANGNGHQQFRYPTGLITTTPSSTVYPYCTYPGETAAVGAHHPSSYMLFQQQQQQQRQQVSDVTAAYSTSSPSTTTATRVYPPTTSVIIISPPPE